MLEQGINMIALVKSTGYFGLFLIVFLESGIPIGFFLPGASLIFAAGLLASQGILNVYFLIPIVVAAAILGDNAGYWLGHTTGVRLFLRPNSRFFSHENLEKAKRFYDAHGTATVFLARFFPVIRTFVPIVAGIVAMDYKTFLSWNIFSGIVWGGGILLLGYYLGAIPLVEQYFGVAIATIIVITTAPLLWHMIRES